MTRRVATGICVQARRYSTRCIGWSPDSRLVESPAAGVVFESPGRGRKNVLRQRIAAGDDRSRPPRRTGSARNGYTLLDTLVIVTAMTFLLGVTGSVLHVLTRTQRQTRQQQVLHRTILRLSSQFRGDVHASQYAEVSRRDEANVRSDRLQLTLDQGERVEYELSEGLIRRLVWGTQNVLQREEYLVPGKFSARWEQTVDDFRVRTISLVIPRRVVGDHENQGTGDSLRISATLGLDHRFRHEP